MAIEVRNLLERVQVHREAIAIAERLHARDHAPAFRIVELLRPGEVDLSSIFRWMLDETGSHGQGGDYRNAFFVTFPEAVIEGAVWDGAIVRCEVPTMHGRRIDILIESADRRHAVVIENKPWAGWQERQLHDYWLDQRCCERPIRAKVLALVGRVEDAQAHIQEQWNVWAGAPNFCEETLFGVGFERVALWIDRCAKMSRPPAVSIFLRDLATFARKHIAGGKLSMTEAHAIAQIILEGGAARIQAARDVEGAMSAVYRGLSASIASAVNGTYELVGDYNVVWVTLDNVRLGFELFVDRGRRPWVGVADRKMLANLTPKLKWHRERGWPAWVHLDQLPGLGRSLNEAVHTMNLEKITSLLNDVAAEVVVRD